MQRMQPSQPTASIARLSYPQLTAVRSCLRRDLGEGARAWLFGSRVDLQRRGGDVDLYVETPRPTSLRDELLCKLHLKEALDLPVDLILAQAGSQTPIGTIAKSTGLEL
jgi:predicted nucleotidyltransferase